VIANALSVFAKMGPDKILAVRTRAILRRLGGQSGATKLRSRDVVPSRRKSLMASWHRGAGLLRVGAATPGDWPSCPTPPRRAGRHFLQIPGRAVPDRILRAMDMPVIDHRGPSSRRWAEGARGIKTSFKTSSPVFIYPSSGRSVEAALPSTRSPPRTSADVRDRPFCYAWRNMSLKLGLQPESSSTGAAGGRERHRGRLKADNGTPSKRMRRAQRDLDGAVSRIDEVRRAIDAAKHPALFMVDTISSLASIDTAR